MRVIECDNPKVMSFGTCGFALMMKERNTVRIELRHKLRIGPSELCSTGTEQVNDSLP